MKKNRFFNTVSLLIASVVIYAVVLVLLWTGIINEYNGNTLIFAGIYVIVALSLNLITGFTGQLALGQAGFMAVGAYATAVSIMKFNVPLFAAILIGGLITAVFGFLIGFPTLRLRGDYLAITTLGFGEIIRVLMVNLESLTGGAAGLKGIPHLFESEDFILNLVMSFTWVFVFALATVIIVSNLINSSPGRAIISIREDEIASNSMGINVPYYKMFSFTMSAFLAGIGGGLYASHIGYINPMMFGFMNSVNFVVIVVLGGLGSITGTILASVVFAYMQEWLRILQDFRMVIFGLILILLMLFWPKGLMGTNEISVVKLVRKILKKESGDSTATPSQPSVKASKNKGVK